jgi:hypothetical protein
MKREVMRSTHVPITGKCQFRVYFDELFVLAPNFRALYVP